MHRHEAHRLVVVARLAVGLGLVGQLWLRWIARGNGSTFTGARLGSALLHSEWVGDWGRGVGVVIFGLALLGAGCVAVAPLHSAAADWAFLALGAAVLLAGAFVLSSGAPPPDRWGPGLFVVAAAAVVAVAVGVAGVVTHRSSVGTGAGSLVSSASSLVSSGSPVVPGARSVVSGEGSPS